MSRTPEPRPNPERGHPRSRRALATVLGLTLLATTAPAIPAYAHVPSSAGEPNAVTRFTRWLADGVTGLFTGDPKGQMRPGGGQVILPGARNTPTPPARPPGKRVKELTGKRTAHGRVFRLDDGRLQVESSAAPTHYRDPAGKWQDIDTRIQALGDQGFRFGNDKTGFSSRFGDETGRLTKLTAGDRWLTLGVAGDTKRINPQVTGAVATYKNVWDGADTPILANQRAIRLDNPRRQGYLQAARDFLDQWR